MESFSSFVLRNCFFSGWTARLLFFPSQIRIPFPKTIYVLSHHNFASSLIDVTQKNLSSNETEEEMAQYYRQRHQKQKRNSLTDTHSRAYTHFLSLNVCASAIFVDFWHTRWCLNAKICTNARTHARIRRIYACCNNTNINSASSSWKNGTTIPSYSSFSFADNIRRRRRHRLIYLGENTIISFFCVFPFSLALAAADIGFMLYTTYIYIILF